MSQRHYFSYNAVVATKFYEKYCRTTVFYETCSWNCVVVRKTLSVFVCLFVCLFVFWHTPSPHEIKSNVENCRLRQNFTWNSVSAANISRENIPQATNIFVKINCCVTIPQRHISTLSANYCRYYSDKISPENIAAIRFHRKVVAIVKVLFVPVLLTW